MKRTKKKIKAKQTSGFIEKSKEQVDATTRRYPILSQVWPFSWPRNQNDRNESGKSSNRRNTA